MGILHLLRTSINTMVNWHDPVLLLKNYYTLIKLNHAIAGLYIWETVFTAGFELDVLRRKRPYRWTIWLYLGTRYTLLFTFISFFIVTDGPRVHCQPFMVATFTSGFASWAFASLIIVLRVIAIWNRNIVVSLVAIGVWSGGLALHIWSLTMVQGTYSPILGVCVVLHMHRGLVNALSALVVDVVLLLAMLIGLLRYTHDNSTGIWKLLYRQCMMWLALAFLAEIPIVVFLILDLNEVWNQMLTAPALAILSIGAARMYRSLSHRGSLTEYVSADLPQFSSGMPIPPVPCRGPNNACSPMRFMPITQSEGTRTTYEAPVFLPADRIQVQFVPGGSISDLAHEDATDKASSTGHETV